MPDTRNCAECGAPLPAYWPKGLCPQCALDGALDMSHGESQVLQPEASAAAAGLLPPPPNGESAPLGTFGDYDLLEEIARGGMGVVYRARQRKLDRIVAVKMILAGPLAGREFVQRFRTEASAAAILQHPNIVAIHDVGVHEGQHYFSMDYIEGRNLTQLVDRQPLPPAKAARCVELIAEAIHYAHDKGILHRDLKPSNVLIDDHEQPRITDFGLAKRLADSTLAADHLSLTLTGQVLGSPNFMPPEQAGTKRGTVGRPSDVYALGGILYYLLTARAPFHAESLEHVITQVLNAEPAPPRLLNPSIPRDLETITLKCLEKEASRRYQTAQELADELGRVLRNEPILARPVSASEKLWRWCRRKPALAGALGFAISALLAGLATTSWQWRRAELNALAERTERNRAEIQAYAADMNLAQQALSVNNLGRVLELLNRHRPQAGQPDRRGWEWRYLWQQAQGDELFTLCQKPIPIFSLAVSPDARLLAVAERIYGHLTLWDIQSRKEILRLPEGDRPDVFYIRVAFSPTEPLLAYGSSSGFPPTNMVTRIRLWNFATNRLVAEIPLEYLCSGLAFSPDGTTLLTSTRDFLTLWDVRTATKVRDPFPIGSHQRTGTPFSVTPDFRFVAQASDSGQLRVFDLAHGREMWTTNVTAGPIEAVALSNDGKLLATGGSGDDSPIHLWNALDGQPISSFDQHPGGVMQLLFGPENRTLISANTDQTIRVWDVSNPASVPTPRTLIGHSLEVWRLALMPDGKTLVSGGKDGSVRFWNLTHPPRRRGPIAVPGGPFVGWSFSENESELLTCDRKGQIIRWSGKAWQTKNVLLDAGLDDVAFGAACFLPDRQGVTIGGSDGTLRVFRWMDSISPKVLTVFPRESWRRKWCMRPHGNRLAVGRLDQQVIHDFDIGTWELKESWRAPGSFQALDFSGDGRYCVMTGYRGHVLVRNMATGEESGFTEVLPNISSVAFSTFGDRVAISCEQGFVRLWETGSWQDAGTLGGFRRNVYGLSFGPDGSRLVAGSSGDEAVRLYETGRYQSLVSLAAEGSGYSPAFDSSGNVLAGMSAEGNLYIWRAPSWSKIESEERSTHR